MEKKFNITSVKVWKSNNEAFGTANNTALESQSAVTAYFPVTAVWRSVCQYSMAEENSATQRQTTVTAYFSSKQLLLFKFSMHLHFL